MIPHYSCLTLSRLSSLGMIGNMTSGRDSASTGNLNCEIIGLEQLCACQSRQSQPPESEAGTESSHKRLCDHPVEQGEKY